MLTDLLIVVAVLTVLWRVCCLKVRVEAGCRVQQVADALKPYGLSLQNYASIREQQIGGFTQVSGRGGRGGVRCVCVCVLSGRGASK
jgi:hypothetical protein